MIIPVPVKLPSSFEKALGYPKGFRWVAFYWEPCGDEAMYDDGYCSADCNWMGFLKFTQHPRVKPWLAGYNLGSSEDAADHWILCDLESRDVLVGERAEVKAFLTKEVRKYLPAGVTHLSQEDFAEIIEKVRNEMKEVPAPSVEEVKKIILENQASVNRMVWELNYQ